ncbi:MAG TPA: hypothetical protein VGR88_00065 [Ktedonobacterales bacterium]|nr:hypothetical protein [Ktedonobacterales bacterium]
MGLDPVGVFHTANGVVYLKTDATTSGYSDYFPIYGVANDIPVAGHWNNAAPYTPTGKP